MQIFLKKIIINQTRQSVYPFKFHSHQYLKLESWESGQSFCKMTGEIDDGKNSFVTELLNRTIRSVG